jgi:hypothetical protein
LIIENVKRNYTILFYFYRLHSRLGRICGNPGVSNAEQMHVLQQAKDMNNDDHNEQDKNKK